MASHLVGIKPQFLMHNVLNVSRTQLLQEERTFPAKSLYLYTTTDENLNVSYNIEHPNDFPAPLIKSADYKG